MDTSRATCIQPPPGSSSGHVSCHLYSTHSGTRTRFSCFFTRSSLLGSHSPFWGSGSFARPTHPRSLHSSFIFNSLWHVRELLSPTFDNVGVQVQLDTLEDLYVSKLRMAGRSASGGSVLENGRREEHLGASLVNSGTDTEVSRREQGTSQPPEFYTSPKIWRSF